MTRARFSIGIDLCTTNCALAFVPLHGEARSEILGIPQWESLSAITESTALPSFLYLPEEAAVAQIQDGEAKNQEWIVGTRETLMLDNLSATSAASSSRGQTLEVSPGKCRRLW
jgi:hypothetical protein